MASLNALPCPQVQQHIPISPFIKACAFTPQKSLSAVGNGGSSNSRSPLRLLRLSEAAIRRRKVMVMAAGASGIESSEEPDFNKGVQSAPGLKEVEGAAVAVAEELSGVADLKKALIDSLYGTERGLRASSETRAEIFELIAQLELKNPTPAPTQALSLLNGKWILQYTSSLELYPLLAAGNLPLVKVGEISQTIDSEALAVQNAVLFIGPLATTSFSTSASFEVLSPKRVQIKFEEGIVGTPQLTDFIDIPENVEVLGQKIDLTSVQGLLRPLQDAASSVARTLSGQPPFKFPIQAENARSWLLTTYLDEDLRISRGDGGSVFILIKEGSSLGS
ncbi:hypothetical protein O6H91_23G011400 [Diphasiastrum complanatum]|uniref:Uncharacterized protein n=1 Tax=Diphasiastrum complanatum TaxID=34168 RepID=A0ACC2A835_DIPCM|nr:hypothetical protein O6H91_23G011400 [Diphasiastrum complanatum]